MHLENQSEIFQPPVRFEKNVFPNRKLIGTEEKSKSYFNHIFLLSPHHEQFAWGPLSPPLKPTNPFHFFTNELFDETLSQSMSGHPHTHTLRS